MCDSYSQRRHTVCCGNTVVFISQCVLVERTEENVCTHVSVVQREGPGSVLFSTDGSQGSEGGCVHVCCGVGGMLECVLPVSVNNRTPPSSLLLLGRQPRWQDTPLCLHIHSLLICFSTASIYLLIYDSLICLCPCFLSASLPSLSSKLPHSLFLSAESTVTWLHSFDPSLFNPSLIGSRTVTWQLVSLPDCVSTSLPTLVSGLQKETEMVKVKEVLKQILQVIWLALESGPPSLCYITPSLQTNSLLPLFLQWLLYFQTLRPLQWTPRSVCFFIVSGWFKRLWSDWLFCRP